MLTESRLKELLSYDPETGVFTWNDGVERFGHRKYGCVAGCMQGTKGNMYRIISLDNRLYYEHRLAFLYMRGKWPEEQIDHIDLNKSNNRWCNLRAATRSQNKQNVTARKDNSSGYKNVYFDSMAGKFHATITIDGKKKFLGLCDMAADAFVLVKEATITHHPKFGRVV